MSFSTINKGGAKFWRLIAALVLITLTAGAVSAQSSRSTLGLYGAYVGVNKSGEAGLFYNYKFSRHFRLGSDVGIVFRGDDRSAMLIDVNAHVPFTFALGRFEVYPLAGVNFSSWTTHYTDEEGTESTSRYNRFGLNGGAGLGFNVSQTLRLGIEGCYTAVRHYNTARVRFSIAYVF